MAQIIQAQNIDLRYLVDNFNIQLVEDDNFFSESRENLPEITETEKNF